MIIMQRRQFLHTGTALAAGAMLGARKAVAAGAKRQAKRPNILFINTDQQHAGYFSSMGNPLVATPNFDRLRSMGVSYENSYSANPVCGPARSCWYTGKYSSELGVMDNSHALRYEIPNLRNHLRDHGYAEAYVGKYGVFYEGSPNHYPLAGDSMGEYSDEAIARTVSAFLHNYDADHPFFLSVGLHQPHDICFWMNKNRIAWDGDMPLPLDQLPPLPKNFTAIEQEAKIMAARRNYQNKNWSEKQWRTYLWVYSRMVEMVDAQIGVILDALERSNHLDNTILIVTADHGEGGAEHQMTHKSFLYDSAARVPLTFYWKNHFEGGRIDTRTLVSGVDLAPTLCDFAGVEPMTDFSGRSLHSILLGNDGVHRDDLLVEDSYGGVLLRDERYAFIETRDENKAQLFDMQADPLQMNNLSLLPAFKKHVAERKTRIDQLYAGMSRPDPIPMNKG